MEKTVGRSKKVVRVMHIVSVIIGLICAIVFGTSFDMAGNELFGTIACFVFVVCISEIVLSVLFTVVLFITTTISHFVNKKK